MKKLNPEELDRCLHGIDVTNSIRGREIREHIAAIEEELRQKSKADSMLTQSAEWYWEVNQQHRQVTLYRQGDRGKEIVMSFIRYGMNGAQPCFNVDGIMVPASDLAVAVPSQEHNISWFSTIENKTARMIANAGTANLTVVKLMRELLAANNILSLDDDVDIRTSAGNRARELTEALAQMKGDTPK